MTHQINRRTALSLLAGSALLPGMPNAAFAAAFPDRPVHFVVPFPPGGAVDIVGSGILLTLAAPVMAVAAVAVHLTSPGPILYRQERVGFGGKIFMCLKFRSMRNDAEKDGVARWATKNDSRVTPVGAFMRKTRIDELPQLISVLKGELSLIGPRPERPSCVAELRQHIPFYDLRHSIKPGLTGWAQVRNGYGASVDEARRKHQFDLFYVKNNSIVLDLLVMIETVSVVLFREGQ